MRFALSFLALLLVALLSISVTEAVARPSHLMTSNGNHYDPKLDQTCFAYTLTCNEDYCPPVTGFDLDCNCPVVAASPDLSAGDNSISWNNGTAHGSGNGTARGELLQVEFCVGGRVAGKKHARFTITTIIVIIIGEIIVPDCHPYPTVCPTECPTECPTVCPTPTEEPTQPQGNDVCEFIITPASLQVNSSTQFDVSLATQPDGPVSVTLSASCVLLSDCLITFDADTWNIPQTIEVYRNPAYQLGNNCTIELVATGAQECNASIPVTILPQPLTPAQTWADPHVMTFDGFYFRAFSTGDFYFVRQFNGNLVIQTRQTACGPASCNTAVAIRFGTLEFYLVLPPTGDAQITIIGDAATNGVTITNTDPVRVYLPGGGFISIKVINEGGNRFLNIEANLPDTYRGQVGGLAGNFDGNPNNELTILQTGAPAANLDAFIASNLVPNSENLFSNSEAVIPPIRGASPPDPVEVGETCTPYSPPNDATPFLQANAANQSPLSGLPLIQSEDSAANCAAAPEAVKQKAISVCSKFFAPDLVGCCTPFGVLSDTYYQSCLCDYALIQNAEFVFAHLLAYASSCETAANSKQKSCAAFASEIEAPQSENQTPCDSNPCLNGGACTNAGTNYQCDCTGTGFKGARCAQRITCAPVALEDHAVWGQSFAGQIAWGKCEAGFVGQPYRSCLESGQFGPITNPCISATTQCAAESYHNAEWSPTNVNTFGSGLCLPGFGGSPTRLCKANAIWSTNVLNFCKRLYCTPENAGGASWKSTASLTTVTARCDVGNGFVQRTCQADGTWGAVQGECAALSSVPCVSETYVRAVWPETQPGETATGRCISGWGGAPKRVCNRDGTWQDLVRDHCQRV